MRNIIFAIALVAAACSSSTITGVRGPSGEQLDTQVSATTVSLGDSVDVTLIVSNPTDSTIHLLYPSQQTRGLFRQNGSALIGNGPAPTPPDTIVLTPGASTTLSTVTVWLMSPAFAPAQSYGDEMITLSPGTYTLSACAFGPTTTQPCANGVTISVTQ